MNHTTTLTPAGPLTILATGAGEVRAAGFTSDVTELLPPAVADGSRARSDLGEITDAVAAYLDGDLLALDEVPVARPAFGEFQAAAWQALRAIRPGVPMTYTQLATVAGRPAAVRAAANACARNPVALFVPCHRVLTVDGGLGGYRWGTGVKRWLLSHEQPN